MRLFRRRQKTEPQVSADRVQQLLSQHYSAALKNLTPARLSNLLDEYSCGTLRSFALLWDAIRTRDDVLRSVEPKRRSAVARLDWEITVFDESAAAQRQKDVLESFFSTISVTSAVDEDTKGGLRLLIRQMLEAVGFGWSAHEIVWQPNHNGLTAQLRHVPLHFFEHRTSRLRYLASDGDYNGVEIEDGGWMVTRADALAVACTILYLFKHMPLRDWLIYCQRYVVPGLHAKTQAKKGTAEWDDLRSAIRSFNLDWALITNTSIDLNPIDMSAKGEMPYKDLVDRCDRGLATLWRGGDLSTISREDSVGSNPQDNEDDILVADDVELINETLNRSLVPHVLRYTIGDVPTLAQFNLIQPANNDTEQQLKVDEFLIDRGAPVSVNDLLERYRRPRPDDDEELATRSPSNAVALANADPSDPTALMTDRAALFSALADDLAPLRARVEAALAVPDAELPNSMAALRDELPALFAEVDAGGQMPDALARAYADAFVDGLTGDPNDADA